MTLLLTKYEILLQVFFLSMLSVMEHLLSLPKSARFRFFNRLNRAIFFWRKLNISLTAV